MIRTFTSILALAAAVSAQVISIESPMVPPEWAYAERALLGRLPFENSG